MTQILRSFLEIETRDEFLKIFPEASKYGGQIEKDVIPFFIAMLALDTESAIHQYFGINVLFNLLGNKDTAEKVEEKYGFRYIDFIKLTGKYDLFKPNVEQRLAEREVQLQELLNSWSWRMTTPLRWLYKHLRKEGK